MAKITEHSAVERRETQDRPAAPNSGVLRVCASLPGGELYCELPLPDGPAGLIDAARWAWRLADALAEARMATARLAAASTAADTPACARGCCGGRASCCRQLVTVSAGEVLAIAVAEADLPPEVRERIEARRRAVLQELEGAGLSDAPARLNDPALPAKAHYDLARAWFALGRDCPYLEAGECLIYAARPAACREYLVAGSPLRCLNPFESPPRTLAPAARAGEALALLTAARLRREVFWLPLAWAAPCAREGARMLAAARTAAWPARGLAEALVRYLEFVTCVPLNETGGCAGACEEPGRPPEGGNFRTRPREGETSLSKKGPMDPIVLSTAV